MSYEQLTRRRFLKIAGAAGAGLGLVTLVNNMSNEEKPTSKAIPLTKDTKIEYGVVYNTQILGGLALQVDAMDLSCGADRLKFLDLANNAKNVWDYDNIRFDKSAGNYNIPSEEKYDFQWQPDRDICKLTPKDGRLAIIDKKFEDVLPADLRSADYSNQEIKVIENGKYILNNKTVAVETIRGNYAMMTFDGFVPREYNIPLLLRLRSMYYGIPTGDIQHYDALIRIRLEKRT